MPTTPDAYDVTGTGGGGGPDAFDRFASSQAQGGGDAFDRFAAQQRNPDAVQRNRINGLLNDMIQKANEEAEANKAKGPLVHSIGILSSLASNLIPGFAAGTADPSDNTGDYSQALFRHLPTAFMQAMSPAGRQETFGDYDKKFREELANRPLAERMAVYSQMGLATFGPQASQYRAQMVKDHPWLGPGEAVYNTAANLGSNLTTYAFPAANALRGGLAGAAQAAAATGNAARAAQLAKAAGAIGLGERAAGAGFGATSAMGALEAARNPNIPWQQKAVEVPANLGFAYLGARGALAPHGVTLPPPNVPSEYGRPMTPEEVNFRQGTPAILRGYGTNPAYQPPPPPAADANAIITGRATYPVGGPAPTAAPDVAPPDASGAPSRTPFVAPPESGERVGPGGVPYAETPTQPHTVTEPSAPAVPRTVIDRPTLSLNPNATKAPESFASRAAAQLEADYLNKVIPNADARVETQGKKTVVTFVEPQEAPRAEAPRTVPTGRGQPVPPMGETPQGEATQAGAPTPEAGVGLAEAGSRRPAPLELADGTPVRRAEESDLHPTYGVVRTGHVVDTNGAVHPLTDAWEAERPATMPTEGATEAAGAQEASAGTPAATAVAEPTVEPVAKSAEARKAEQGYYAESSQEFERQLNDEEHRAVLSAILKRTVTSRTDLGEEAWQRARRAMANWPIIYAHAVSEAKAGTAWAQQALPNLPKPEMITEGGQPAPRTVPTAAQPQPQPQATATAAPSSPREASPRAGDATVPLMRQAAETLGDNPATHGQFIGEVMDEAALRTAHVDEVNRLAAMVNDRPATPAAMNQSEGAKVRLQEITGYAVRNVSEAHNARVAYRNQVWQDFHQAMNGRLEELRGQGAQPADFVTSKTQAEGGPQPKEPSTALAPAETPPAEHPIVQSVLDAGKPIHIEAAAKQSGTPLANAGVELTMAELAGKVRRLPGNMYEATGGQKAATTQRPVLAPEPEIARMVPPTEASPVPRQAPAETPVTDEGIRFSREPGQVGSEVYLNRHGETNLNHPDKSKEVLRGSINDERTDLNANGRKEAERQAQELKGHIERTVASPLNRTVDTRNAVNEAGGIKDTATDPGLEPWHLGAIEGEMTSAAAAPLLKDYVLNKPDTPLPGKSPSGKPGESFNDWKAKTLDAVRGYLEQAKSGQAPPTGLFSHYRVLKLVEAKLAADPTFGPSNDIDTDTFLAHSADVNAPGSIHKMWFDGQDWHMEDMAGKGEPSSTEQPSQPGKYVVSRDGSVITLTPHGRQMGPRMGISQAFRSVFLPDVSADRLQANLADIASHPAAPPYDKLLASELLNHVIEGRKASGDGSVILTNGDPKSVQEEVLHRALNRIDTLPASRLPAQDVMSHPLAEKATPALDRMKYPDNPVVRADELLAKLGSGQHEALGLTSEEAGQLLGHILEVGQKVHGDRFQEVLDLAREAHEQYTGMGATAPAAAPSTEAALGGNNRPAPTATGPPVPVTGGSQPAQQVRQQGVQEQPLRAGPLNAGGAQQPVGLPPVPAGGRPGGSAEGIPGEVRYSLEPPSTGGAGTEGTQRRGVSLTEAMNTFRPVLEMGSMHAQTRQGMIFSLARPKAGAAMLAASFQSAKTEAGFNAIQDTVKNDPEMQMMQDAGLHLTDRELSNREEAFQSSLAERLPGVGRIVRASSRAMAGGLNMLRYTVAKQGIAALQATGINPANNPKAYVDLARYINLATGWGRLSGKIGGAEFNMEDAAPALNAVLYSPRFQASRLQLMRDLVASSAEALGKAPGRGTYDPAVRKMMLQDAAKVMGFQLIALAAAKAAGLGVSTDPTNTDFGRIKVGNTRVDLTAGFGGYMRDVLKVGAKVAGYQTSGVTPKYGEQTGKDVVENFVRGKLAPIPSMLTDVLAQKDIAGNPVTPWTGQYTTPAGRLSAHPVPGLAEQWNTFGQRLGAGDIMGAARQFAASTPGERLTPIVAREIWDAMQHPPEEGIPLGVGAFFGVGEYTREPKETAGAR